MAIPSTGLITSGFTDRVPFPPHPEGNSQVIPDRININALSGAGVTSASLNATVIGQLTAASTGDAAPPPPAPAPYHEAVIADGPLAWWTMDTIEGTRDFNHVRNTSFSAPEYIGSATLAQLPVISRKKSILLDGTDYVRVLTDNTSLWNGESVYTNEFWIVFNSIVNGMSVIGQHAAIASANGWALVANANGAAISFNLFAKDGAANFAFNVGTASDYAIGQKLHIVVITSKANGGIYRLYINNVKVIDGTSTLAVDWSGASFRIGKSNDGFWANPDFTVDEYALYSGSLSETSIATHYNVGLSNSTITPYATRILNYAPLFYIRCKETDWTGDPTGSVSSEVAVAGRLDLFGQTTVANRPTQNASGLIYNDSGSKTFQYDGTNDYISSEFGPLNLGSYLSLTAWTICAWVKPTTVGAVYQGIVGGHDTAIAIGPEPFYLKVTNNRVGQNHGFEVEVTLSDSSTLRAKGNLNQPEPEANARYHVAATFDKTNGELILYINGGKLEISTFSNTLTMQSGCDHVIVGADRLDGVITDFAASYISDVSWHNTVLTPNDIAALAASAVD